MQDISQSFNKKEILKVYNQNKIECSSVDKTNFSHDSTPVTARYFWAKSTLVFSLFLFYQRFNIKIGQRVINSNFRYYL